VGRLKVTLQEVAFWLRTLVLTHFKGPTGHLINHTASVDDDTSEHVKTVFIS